MRCTSTPRTPEPSPRPKAAIARRARSLSASSEPSLSAAAICWRSVSRLMSLLLGPSARVASVMFLRAAWASVARKKKRSKTSSNTLRSSLDLARVAASASLKSGWAVQSTWVQRFERVEDLGGADRHALASEVLGEGEELAVESARRVLGDAAVDRALLLAAAASACCWSARRPGPPPCPGRCGA